MFQHRQGSTKHWDIPMGWTQSQPCKGNYDAQTHMEPEKHPAMLHSSAVTLLHLVPGPLPGEEQLLPIHGAVGQRGAAVPLPTLCRQHQPHRDIPAMAPQGHSACSGVVVPDGQSVLRST